jgi:hypothetical protein
MLLKRGSTFYKTFRLDTEEVISNDERAWRGRMLTVMLTEQE